MRLRVFSIFLAVLPFLTWAPRAAASVAPDVQDDRVTLAFPDTATFSARLSSSSLITSVVLEYGSKQLGCGEVIAKAFPEFTSAEIVEVEWTWEMRQSGSLPPGAQLWWRWRYSDGAGQEHVSTKQTATWIDDVHRWKSLNDGANLRLHWYEGDEAFAEGLLKAAAAGLQYNEAKAGLAVAAPIDIYVYADVDDLRDAILYEPSWTGGTAYAEHDIVILGIPPTDLAWGRSVIVHELTHVLVGHLTFTCLGEMPTWLSEGLAVYAEGGIDPAWQAILDDAVGHNTLLPVRSLGGSFSEVPATAVLSYSQSYSLVQFLIETEGQENMTSLLVALRDGAPIDEALVSVYGFDVDGLDGAWRAAVGAPARSRGALPTARPSPTFVPTIQPVSGGWLAVNATPAAPTTPAVQASPVTEGPAGPPTWLTLALLAVCCVLLLLVGVIILSVVVRSGRGKSQ